jgi:cytochrome d ubiquinol oxidase subunit II
MLPDLAVALLLLGLTGYAVLGGADFGAGFWDLTAGGPERGARVRQQIKASMSAVWEANHVWLIFALVIAWTAFPRAFGSVMSTLYLPLFIAALGIVARGMAFALKGEAATISEARTLGAIFALSSVVVPFFLGTVVGAIASGRVPVGSAAGSAFDPWVQPLPIFAGVLSVALGAHMAAVFLGADSERAGRDDLVSAFRARALGSGIVTGALAIAGLFVLNSDAPDLFDGLTSGAGLAFVLLSGIAGVVTVGLEWRGRFQPARFTAAVAVGSIVAGWAFAQRPDILPGELTLDAAAASDATLGALLGCAAVGLCILLPSLAYLYRLVLRGDLEKEFEPITHPKETGT